MILLKIIKTIINKVKQKGKTPLISKKPVFEDKIIKDGAEYSKAYEYEEVEIYGVDFCSKLPLQYGERLYVLPEPKNKVDPKAVVINAERKGKTYKIGYISRGNRLQDMVYDYKKYGGLVLAYCDNPNRYTMMLAFYKKVRK